MPQLKNISNQIIATIDIGTNSMLMLGSRTKNQKTEFLFDHYFMPRLGEGFAQTQRISQEALSRARSNLIECKSILDEQQIPYQVFITASSAIREAKNQKEALDYLQGVFINSPIEIISGNTEAYLSYLSLHDCYTKDTSNIVFDIGGGSTEIALGHNKTLSKSQSIKFGTVKLLDLFFQNSRSSKQIKLAHDHIIKKLSLCSISPQAHTDFFGTAGSFTQTASMLLKLKTYSKDKVNGFKIEYDQVREHIQKLSTLTINDIKLLPGIDPKRADVILPGLIIIQCLMEHFKTQSIQVYDRGIRYGKLFEIINLHN